MTFLWYILLVLEVIVAFLLIGVILLQRSKDQGLGLAFGSGMGETLFGSQTVNVLMKATIVLAAIFFLNTMLLARISSGRNQRRVAVPRPVPAAPAAPAGAAHTPMPVDMDIPGGTEPAAGESAPLSAFPAGGSDEPVPAAPADATEAPPAAENIPSTPPDENR